MRDQSNKLQNSESSRSSSISSFASVSESSFTSVSELSSAKNAEPLSRLFRPRTPAFLDLDLSPPSDKALTPIRETESSTSSKGLTDSPLFLSGNTSVITSPITNNTDANLAERLFLIIEMHTLFNNFKFLLEKNRNANLLYPAELQKWENYFRKEKDLIENDILKNKENPELESSLKNLGVHFFRFQETINAREKRDKKFYSFFSKKTAGDITQPLSPSSQKPKY